MASTYSPSLKITLMGDGDQAGLWGQTTNTNLGTLVEQAITGVVSITMSNANYTLTSFNGITDEARNAVLVVTGSNSAVRDLIPPVAEKLYTVVNNTTGGFAIRVIGASGTGVNIPNGATCLVYCDGTNFINGLSGSTGNFTVNGTLSTTGALTYGGVTLSNSVTGTGSMALSASPTFTGTPAAPTASPGTNTTQIATTAFALANGIPSGAIVLWSGSIGSIPSGWLLCNGSSGTPDLRDRFVVGAGSTYAVAATGGNANATLVSHTHTFTGNALGTHDHTLTTNRTSKSGNNTPFMLSDPNVGENLDGSAAFNTNSVSAGTPSGTNSTEGSSATNANLPPYYALAYIMKA
jgi:microcystin-dependent protein